MFRGNKCCRFCVEERMGVLPDYILIYMIILAVMDIKRRQVHLSFLLSGIIWVILSVICERTVSTGEIIAEHTRRRFFFYLVN